MGRIAVLPADVAAQIAAGEVVERPASIVKELCDNALDAGARRIRVELEDGGLRSLAVTDDGVGMDPEDAALCFLRHATSKIRTFADIHTLGSLGFRGEALPSVAAVCRVELVTRPAGAEAATAVRVEGGGAPHAFPAAGAPGTRVVARDLFFNTPARRAALRSAAQERAAALEVVTACALARPDVAFEVVSDGREVLAAPGDGELLSVAVALWGPDVARALLAVRAQEGGWELDGLASPPAQARGHRGLQFLSVDGRPVRPEAVRGPVEAAYQNLLMTRRFPVFVLRLRALQPGLYDPNVHPSKREVRLYAEHAVRELCRRAVRAALRGADLVTDAGLPSLAAAFPAGGGPAPSRGATAHGAARPWSVARDFALAAQAALAAAEPDAAYPPDAAPPARVAADVAAGPPLPAAPGATRLPPLRPLGQVADAYVVAEGPDGLYLLDQHAAHERVFFERLAAPRPVATQPLVAPLPVSLGPERYRRWEEAAQEIAAAGFTVEPFGDGAVLLRAAPAALPGDPAAMLVGVLDRLDGHGAGPAEVRRAMAACKAAIKAGQRLAAADIAALLDDLGRCEEPFTCPHGRPTVVRLGVDELGRLFRRR